MAVPQAMTGHLTSEPPIRWRKSSYSGDTGNCVEVTPLPSSQIGIRDSKNLTGPTLLIGHEDWRRFIANVRTDEML